MKEIAYARIVTVAKNRLAAEMLLIVNKLTFYIAKLRIELILLVTLSLAKLTIFRTHLKGLPSVLTRGPEKPIRNTRREATLVREPPTCHFLLKFLRFRVSDLLQFPANAGVAHLKTAAW